ncbi:hypothetical protein [Arsukibacterium tuosuense]|nr:hypothetical protein [Arsukibacterium tuosuense]
MNTCCVENQCYDEYQRIANYTKALLDDNLALFDAIEKALVSSFDDLVKERHVCAVMKSIANLL